MSSHRQIQLEELLFRTISQIFLEEYEFPEGVVVTVFEVKLSGDLRAAKVFVSIFPFSKKENVFSFLESQGKHIRHEIAKRVSLKYIPTIELLLDTREEQAEEILHLMKNPL